MSTIVFAKEDFIIKGVIEKIEGNVCVALVKYDDQETQIAKTYKNTEGVICFAGLKGIEEGVYKLVINTNKNNYQFDLIIDNVESYIQFDFNPLVDELPLILNSNINKNYYLFLKTQSLKLKIINKIKNEIEPTNNLNSKKSNNFMDSLLNEIKQLNQSKEVYVKSNFNKWSSALVKNSINEFEFDEIPKVKFWKRFETNNSDFINTPIYQEIIRNYTVKYYSNADENEYKEALDEIIKQFSKNPITKKWVIKYMATGLNRLGNKNLESYFSEKYNYKV